MIVLRLSVLAIFAAAAALGVAADRRAVYIESLPPPVVVGTPLADGRPWFCAGGSGADGPAVAGVEIANATDTRVAPVITVMGSDPDDVVSHQVTVEPYGRIAVSLGDLSSSPWLAAVVEPGSADVVVDQTRIGPSGTDRSICTTRISSTAMLPDGATRSLAYGEQMTLLLFTPLLNDSIVDVVFDADTGTDSLEAVVVPGRRILALDATGEVTEAERVSTTVDVGSGAVAAARLQVRNGPMPLPAASPECPDIAGDAPAEAAAPETETDESPLLQGLSVMPAIADGAAVSVLPSVRRCEGRNTVLVTNPSRDTRAEVDLELIADGERRLAPIQLTVPEGRTVAVELEADTRLAPLNNKEISILARSLNRQPVAVMLEQRVPLGGSDTPGLASMGALDAASTRWLAPVEGEGSAVSVVNPSATATASVKVSVAGSLDARALTFALAGNGRLRLDSEQIAGLASGDGLRPILLVEADAPVVVGREHVGETSRSMLAGVVAGPVTPLSELS